MLVPVHINTLELFVQLTCFLLLFAHIPVFLFVPCRPPYWTCTLEPCRWENSLLTYTGGKVHQFFYLFFYSSTQKLCKKKKNIDCSFLWMGKLSIDAKLCYIPGWKHFNMLIYGDWLLFGTADFGASALASFYSPRHSVLMSTRFFQFVPQQEPPTASCAEI